MALATAPFGAPGLYSDWGIIPGSGAAPVDPLAQTIEIDRNKSPSRSREPAFLPPFACCMVRTMQHPAITTELTPTNFFERLAGMRFAYRTTITDGAVEVVGRGSTPEASHEEAQTQSEFAQLVSNTATMFP